MSNKTFRCVLLSVLLVCVCITLFACGDDNVPQRDLKDSYNDGGSAYEVAVLSDLHVFAESLIGDPTYASFQSARKGDFKSYAYSESINAGVLKKVKASGVKSLLISGDLTENASTAHAEALAALLADVETAGINVYVVPGNHDLNDVGAVKYTAAGTESTELVDAADFERIYANYGYDRAIGKNGLSYVADLNEKLRLVAIDNCNVELDDNFFQWLDTVLKAASSASKSVVVMMHKPITEVFGSVMDVALTLGLRSSGSATTAAEKLCAAFTENGVSLVLTGHNHTNDAAIVTKGEKSFVEVETVSTIQIGASVRRLSFAEGVVKISTEEITGIDEDCIADYASAADAALLKSDLKTLLSNKLREGLESTILGVADKIAPALSKILGDEADAGLNEWVQTNLIDFALQPFYRADGGENSYEAYFQKYDVQFPQSDYADVVDMATKIAGAKFSGNEHLSQTQNPVEFKLLSGAVCAIIANLVENGLYEILGCEPAETTAVQTFCRGLVCDGVLEVENSGFLSAAVSVLRKALEGKSIWNVLKAVLDDGSSFNAAAALVVTFGNKLGLDLNAYFTQGYNEIYEEVRYNGEIKFAQLLKEVALNNLLADFFFDTAPNDTDLYVSLSDASYQ